MLPFLHLGPGLLSAHHTAMCSFTRHMSKACYGGRRDRYYQQRVTWNHGKLLAAYRRSPAFQTWDAVTTVLTWCFDLYIAMLLMNTLSGLARILGSPT